MNVELNIIFLIKPFSYMAKKPWQNLKYLEKDPREGRELLNLQASVLLLYWKRHSDAVVLVGFFCKFCQMFLKKFFYGISQVAASLSPKFVKSFHFVFELKICVFSPFYTVYCLLWHQTCFRLSQKWFKNVVRNDLIGTPMEMFSCGLAKCLRTAFLIKQLRWLLLCASNLFRKPC